MTSLEFQSTARAIATVCRWPPERRGDRRAHRLQGAHRQAVEGLAGARSPWRPRRAGRASSARGRGTCCGRRRGCRTARGPGRRPRCPSALASLGPCTVTGWPSKRYSPVVEGVDAGDALDQGALAGAVVTDERGDLAGADVEVDAAEHVHGAEALLDAAQAEQRRCRSSGGRRAVVEARRRSWDVLGRAGRRVGSTGAGRDGSRPAAAGRPGRRTASADAGLACRAWRTAPGADVGGRLEAVVEDLLARCPCRSPPGVARADGTSSLVSGSLTVPVARRRPRRVSPLIRAIASFEAASASRSVSL